MKKCPSCDKTFEDSMRFCQADGTPLVDDQPAFDPYATIVAQPKPVPPDADEPVIHQTMGSVPIAVPDDVLDLPEVDPLKTMYASSAEMEGIMADGPKSGESDLLEVELVEESSPAPPEFNIPDVPSPSFGSVSPPPSPFSETVAAPEIFEDTPQPEGYQEAETQIRQNLAPQFETPTAAADWAPPPAPDASWQNQQIGVNTPFQPPMASVTGQDKTLAIISMVLGIVSVPGICCYFGPLTGLGAIITGYLAIKNVNENPGNYGGKPLAIVGMILGGLFFLLGVVYYAWLFLFGGMATIMEIMRQQQGG